MADIREKSDEKIDQIQKSVDDMKRRELEQTQKLLVGLTNELFDKVEEMNPTKEESKVEEMSASEKTPKFEFSDISWYRRKFSFYEKEGKNLKKNIRSLQKINSNQEKRICVTLEDNVYKKLLFFQAKMIQESHGSCNYSEAINYLLGKYFFKK